MPIQTAISATSFIIAGTTGQLLQSRGTTATWVSTSTLRIGFADNSNQSYVSTLTTAEASPQRYITMASSTGTFNTLGAIVDLDYNTNSKLLRSPTISITSSTNSTSTTSGALTVSGGVGIGKSLNVGETVRILGITTVSNTINASSTVTGALQVIGGVGIGRDLYVGGGIYGIFNGTFSGTINTATNLTGGKTGSIPYQSTNGITQFINTGTVGSLLQMGATTASFVSTSSIHVKYADYAVNTIGTANFAGTATTSTNLAGGIAGQVPYQTAPGRTSFFGPGLAGTVLIGKGATVPEFSTNLPLSGALFVGVSTTSSGAVVGEIRASNEITAYYASDVRLKDNIKPIEDALAKIRKLQGVTFEWKDFVIDTRGGDDGYYVRKKDTGIIAQEVEQVLPEVVAQREDGFKAVRYEKLAGLIIQAINELADEVDRLKNKIQ
jgi:hypothetical protein